MEGLVLFKGKIQDLLDDYKSLFYKVELYNEETSWMIDFKMDEIKQILEDIDNLILLRSSSNKTSLTKR